MFAKPKRLPESLYQQIGHGLSNRQQNPRHNSFKPMLSPMIESWIQGI